MYLKLQGVASNVFSKLHRMNGDSMRIDELADALKKLEVQSQPIQPVHVEFLIKYQGKVIYALHLNQTAFDKWTEGDSNMIVFIKGNATVFGHAKVVVTVIFKKKMITLLSTFCALNDAPVWW